MSAERDKSWILSLIGGIITLVAIFTPAAHPTKNTEIVWMWGLTLRNSISFMSNTVMLIVSIVCSAGIIICAIILILKANKLRTSEVEIQGFGKILLIMGIMILVLTASWAAIIHILITQTEEWTERRAVAGGYEETTYRRITFFWGFNFPGFGLIGPLIGAVLAMAGGLKRIVKER